MINVSDPSEDFNLDFAPDFSERKPKVESKAIQSDTSVGTGKVISLDLFRKGK